MSDGIYASLNGSYASGDETTKVDENRRRMATVLSASTITSAKQTHSATALFVSGPLDRDDLPVADALITDTPGLAVAVLTADCVPILLEAPGLVAAVHAGWRGSMRGIIASAVAMMEDRGAERAEIKAAIGPCLRRENFEVRQDLIAEVTSQFPDAAEDFTPISQDQSLYDHIHFVRKRLKEQGVLENNISDVGGDTLANQDHYFSYRGARKAGCQKFGHNLSAIALDR